MKHINKIFKKNWKLNLKRNFGSKSTSLKEEQDKRREYLTFMNTDSEGKTSTYEMNDNQMIEYEESYIRKSIKKIFHIMKIRRKI